MPFASWKLRGYVVTFRETDPLYALDLSDPSNPQALGELKITGFSSYLHPVAENLLLGVGQEADETGRREGLQLSLFDTSDPSQPQRIDQWLLSEHLDLSREKAKQAGFDGRSPVEDDHRAFLWHQKQAFIPFSAYWEAV